MRRQLTFAIGAMIVALAGVVYTITSGNEPLLGLDLQGGASVVLEPEPNEDGSEISGEVLDQAVDIIRNRVDGLGVREPEISRQGSTILVQIPGVEDQQRAIDLVGQTAELRFRPLLQETVAGTPFASEHIALCAPESADDEEAMAALYSAPTPDADADECMVAVDRAGLGVQYLLGPAPLLVDQQSNPGARLTGETLETASARLQLAEWVVNISFKSGSPGIDDFNALAAECSNGTQVCPPTGTSPATGAFVGRVAVEIDGVVESAPTVGISNFDRGQVVISGGAMTERDAKDLALVLRFGSLPVELTPQESRIVSSTLGEDALDAGIVAGIIGLALVSVYLLVYYRFLGVVAIASLAVSGAMLWTMISWLGESQGLALTLAGVTGLIVSIGVSVDSNVVYFEHLKEDVRAGRTVRSAVERAFPIAFSTIVKADVASLIAAVVLYFLTVGQVRGFALFLGLATVLDLVATYFFMGPVIRLMARRDSMGSHPKRFGIPLVGVQTTQVSA
ncbi:MAG: protein translocase subunit SecD [Acidimicrobiaceae bacterium]|nr:protein translocase subunit SecD [Acidimicrobiaceae bacterium]